MVSHNTVQLEVIAGQKVRPIKLYILVLTKYLAE